MKPRFLINKKSCGRRKGGKKQTGTEAINFSPPNSATRQRAQTKPPDKRQKHSSTELRSGEERRKSHFRDVYKNYKHFFGSCLHSK